MTLELWEKHGWLRPHKTSDEELNNIFSLVDRDLRDAQNHDLSIDWRFNIAYNAALQLATAVLYSTGFRTGRGESKHYRVIQAIPLVMGDEMTVYRDFFESCRKKRNITEYDMAGTVSEKEVKDLLETVLNFKALVTSLLKNKNI